MLHCTTSECHQNLQHDVMQKRIKITGLPLKHYLGFPQIIFNFKESVCENKREFRINHVNESILYRIKRGNAPPPHQKKISKATGREKGPQP